MVVTYILHTKCSVGKTVEFNNLLNTPLHVYSMYIVKTSCVIVSMRFSVKSVVLICSVICPMKKESYGIYAMAMPGLH